MKKMEAKDRLLLVDGWHNIASEGYMGIDSTSLLHPTWEIGFGTNKAMYLFSVFYP